VFELLGVTYDHIKNDLPWKVFSKNMLQEGLHMILFGVDLLHQAGVVHTGNNSPSPSSDTNQLTWIADLLTHNIMVGVQDPTVWSIVEQGEIEHPSALKTVNGYTIYQSRRLLNTQWITNPTITDLSEARFGKAGEMHSGDNVMPDHCRAPEVILGMEWDSKIDMWCIGLMVR
jgi:hypothetical protein